MDSIRKSFAALFSAALIIAAPMSAHAIHAPVFDEHIIELEYSDAPEGTAYIDVLVKSDRTDESYTKFNLAPKRLVDKAVEDGNTQFFYEVLPIDENSEIARYNEDGFISLTIHSDKVTDLELMKDFGYESDRITLSCFADDLYNDYGNAEGFKIAYVSETGKVLGVTKKVRHSYDASRSYAFIAKGEKAGYRTFGISPVIVITVISVIAAIPVLIIWRIREKILWIKLIREITHNPPDKDDTENT